MKKILLLAVLTAFGTQLYAGHYIQKGNIDKKKSSFTIKDIRINAPKESQSNGSFFSFDQEAADILFGKDSKINVYTGASGRSYKISEIFEIYENRARAVGENMDYSFTSNHDEDVYVVVSKKGKIFTIDIYTGEDAIKAKANSRK